MMMNAPCSNCPARQAGCHADCLSYAIYRAKKQIAYNQAALRHSGAYRSDTAIRATRKRQMEQKKGR